MKQASFCQASFIKMAYKIVAEAGSLSIVLKNVRRSSAWLQLATAFDDPLL